MFRVKIEGMKDTGFGSEDKVVLAILVDVTVGDVVRTGRRHGVTVDRGPASRK